jgi:hypothetical protein
MYYFNFQLLLLIQILDTGLNNFDLFAHGTDLIFELLQLLSFC